MARRVFWAVTVAAWGVLVPVAAAQSVVTLETEIDSGTTRILVRALVQARAGGAAERVVATVSHRAGEPPMGALSPDGRTVALATVASGGEPRRHAEVVLVDVASGRARTVLRDVQQVPPAWSDDSRTVYGVRSFAMPPPSEAETRRGRLESERLVVEAVRAADGAVRDACVDVAYVLHPIGVARATGELVVIRVSWQGASVRAIDPASCATRDLASDAGDLLRDAHLDGRGENVVYLRRRARSREATIEQVAVSGGAARIVARVDDRAMPVPIGDGVAYTSGATLVSERARVDARGAAISVVAVSEGGALVVHRTSANGHAYSVIAPGTARERALSLAPRTTLSVAGFLEGTR